MLKDLGQNEKGSHLLQARLLAGRPAGHTDTYVQRLKDLGFIIVGRTNTPEFGFKISQMPACMVLSIFPWTPVAMLVDQVVVQPKTGFRHGFYCCCIGWWWLNSHPSLLQWLDRTQNQSWSDSSWSQVLSWLAGASVNFALTKSVRDTQRLLYHFQDYQLEAPFPCQAERGGGVWKIVSSP